MDWSRVFNDMRKKDNGEVLFSKALFDNDSWFLKLVNIPKSLKDNAPSEEKKEILKAIKDYAQEKAPAKKESTKTVQEKIPENENIFAGAKISLGDQESENLKPSTGITHEFHGVSSDFSFLYGEEQRTLLSKTPLSNSLDILFVGDTYIEGVSDFEDLLGKMIEAMKLSEGSFSRVFYSDEIKDEEYLKRLLHEIHIVKPLYVITMGAKMSSLLLKRKDRLSKIHGKFFPVKIVDQNDSSQLSFEVFPIFHPDFLRIKTSMKRTTWMDLQKIMSKLVQE